MHADQLLQLGLSLAVLFVGLLTWAAVEAGRVNERIRRHGRH